MKNERYVMLLKSIKEKMRRKMNENETKYVDEYIKTVQNMELI